MSDLILDYIKSGVERFPDSIYGESYRCSVYLTDGTFLPCVMLRKSSPVVELAIRRFAQEKKGKGIFGSRDGNGYESIVKTFVAAGNRVNHYDIARVEPSRFAIPLSLLKQIEGETTMAWTGFVFEMNDGKLFSYGTTFGMEFFCLPDGYGFDNVVAVHNHSYVSPTGVLGALAEGMAVQPSEYAPSLVLRERPYFVCYYDA
ncbi:MAG: hypothetical protein EAZ24_10190 [Burkholderiales bacterium]|nr:MAG: hypothetical protein EAZ24_10190 [Burkholderiales bacterium]TAG82757.1 MAG: hypothetical protein EAZ21_02655 [Betaproteobacteria bacterium]